MDILLGCLAVLFAVPLLTGFCAISYSRSFWLWFVLAMVLPFLSWFLLIYLIHQDEKATKAAASLPSQEQVTT